MRWFLLVLALIGFALAFTTKSSAVLALALVFGGVGILGFVFALAADRVAASTRPDSAMASMEDLARLGRARAAPPKPAAPPSGPDPRR